MKKVRVIRIRFESKEIEIDDSDSVKRRSFDNAQPHLLEAQQASLNYMEQIARAIKGPLKTGDILGEIIDGEMMTEETETIIDEIESCAKAKWIPIRDLNQEGYAKEFVVFLMSQEKWGEIKEKIKRNLKKD